MKTERMKIDPGVFIASATAVVIVLAFGVAAPDRARTVFLGLQDLIVSRLDWLFMGSTAIFLVFSLGIAIAPTGRIRLGPDDAPPAYGFRPWFAMLFSAGMGIGIMFYGVAEPLTHYAAPPRGLGGTAESARLAMTIAFYHWGFHAWAVYVVMGLAIAYFGHRRGFPLAVRSTLHPFLGEKIHGPLGQAVDTLAVFGTLFGLATSLGLGAMQVNAGLHRLFGTTESTVVQVALIAAITAAATTSVVLGLDRGIRRLSELNVALAVSLLLFVVIAGPTTLLLKAFPARLFDYGAALFPLALGLRPLGDLEWNKSWTIFYWAWWIAWSPFVGTFIARISRGRTVREFVVGVLFVPTLVSALWFTVFGWTAIHMDSIHPGLAEAVRTNIPTGIYAMLDRLPWAGATSLLAAVVVAVFFITSSDSGSFVVDMLTSGGHPNPPVWQRVFWAVSEGVVAAVLLVGGGLRALQSAAINTGLPFCLVLLVVCAGLGRSLWIDARNEAPGE